MREIFKAYSLSLLIHSLLLFGFFLLTQRFVPSEKRLIEIDLSLENVQRQPSADLSQKAQPLPARLTQMQPVSKATIPPAKEEIKSSTAKRLKQEEGLIQSQTCQSPQRRKLEKFKPLKFKPSYIQKKKRRVKPQNTQGKEKDFFKPKKFPKSQQVKREKGKIFRLRLTKAWRVLQDPHPHLPMKVEG
ncbi:hypothetical protein [Thermocrinis sp.]|jgi:hypothetical protein|uniref:hypothetical protein n=1 Tax=Thermocrinis sp. TaxID=2024383 RepID=UPI003BFCF86D